MKKNEKPCFRGCVTEKIDANSEKIEQWFQEQFAKVPVPPYTSIDLRDSGFKASPVDSNVFPAGFNNICQDDWRIAAQAFAETLKIKGEKAKSILIIPENHTKNAFYFENLRCLKEILELANFKVTIGHLNPQLEDNQGEGISEVSTSSGHKLLLYRLSRSESFLKSSEQEFTSDTLILLNNDLSEGFPKELEKLDNVIMPTPHMGWHRRLKSEHLKHYCDLAIQFAELIDVDPFFFTPRFTEVRDVNFASGENMEKVAAEVDTLLEKIREDYYRNHVDAEAFVFIKHNAGTYGRSIMHVKSGEEILQMNRRAKNKMHVSKGGVEVSNVLLMEGIPTDWKEEEQIAEPVIYLAGEKAVGGFLRINPNRDAHSNLNSPGAHFKTLCFANLYRDAHPQAIVLEKFYGLLGRLSTLANGYEML